MKHNNKEYRSICHNNIDDDYTIKDVKKDLEEAIKAAQTIKNGHPQCTYRW